MTTKWLQKFWNWPQGVFGTSNFWFNSLFIEHHWALKNTCTLTSKWHLKSHNRPQDVFGTLNWAYLLNFIELFKNILHFDKRDEITNNHGRMREFDPTLTLQPTKHMIERSLLFRYWACKHISAKILRMLDIFVSLMYCSHLSIKPTWWKGRIWRNLIQPKHNNPQNYFPMLGKQSYMSEKLRECSKLSCIFLISVNLTIIFKSQTCSIY